MTHLCNGLFQEKDLKIFRTLSAGAATEGVRPKLVGSRQEDAAGAGLAVGAVDQDVLQEGPVVGQGGDHAPQAACRLQQNHSVTTENKDCDL